MVVWSPCGKYCLDAVAVEGAAAEMQHMLWRGEPGAELVATWFQRTSQLCRVYTGFFTALENTWLVSGTHYMYPLFVNCGTGQMFKSPNEPGKEEGFIFCECFVNSAAGTFIADGCYWGFPYMLYVYILPKICGEAVSGPGRRRAACITGTPTATGVLATMKTRTSASGSMWPRRTMPKTGTRKRPGTRLGEKH